MLDDAMKKFYSYWCMLEIVLQRQLAVGLRCCFLLNNSQKKGNICDVSKQSSVKVYLMWLIYITKSQKDFLIKTNVCRDGTLKN